MYTFEIKQWIFSLKEEEIILASKVYKERFSYMKETTFHQLLARLNDENYIGKISKGVYFKPREKEPYKLPSHENLINFFTGKDKNGMIVGQKMLSKYNIIFNTNNKYRLFTNLIEIKTTRKISNIEVEYLNVDFKNLSVRKIIELLELVNTIEDEKAYSLEAMKEMIENSIYYYDEAAMKKIIETKRYMKRDYKALSLLLKHYNVGNSIDSYLNKNSVYKIPNAILRIVEE